MNKNNIHEIIKSAIEGFMNENNTNINSPIFDFIENIEYYQSNHLDTYNRNELVISYNNLPEEIKILIKPNTTKYLYRGADGLDNKQAISFTKNKSYADTFGIYTIPITELNSYTGLIDTQKLVRFLNKNKFDHDIGDDEGEVIVLNPTYKNNLIKNIENFRN